MASQTLGWQWIHGCWRYIDGVSKNRVHIDCNARNTPVATVQELLNADLSSPALPAGYGAGALIPGGEFLPIVPTSDGLFGWSGYRGFGNLGVSFGSPLFSSSPTAGSGTGDLSPVAFLPDASLPEEPLLALTVTDLVTGQETTTSTLQPLPDVPATTIPEPVLFCLWLAAVIVVVRLHRKSLRDGK